VDVVAARSQRRAALPIALALLVVANVGSNRLVPDWAYVPWNLTVAAALSVLAVWAGATRAELGWHRWGRGAAFGGVIAGLVLVTYLLALAMPALADLFDDERVQPGLGVAAYQALVRIPLGTVLLEELAFRSVLPALILPWVTRAASSGTGTPSAPKLTRRAYVWASLAFGLWHVLPALGIADVNPVLDDVFSDAVLGTTIAVALAVLATTVAGLLLSWVRVWSGSVLAPILVHISTNSFGYSIAWIVTR
jgi:membrane protease YdiL (CAAX protease family)